MNIINHYLVLHSIYKYEGRFNSAGNIEEATSLVRENKIKAEIIGKWLYCYTTDLIGVQLLSIGFWYSKKHNAYVYSGNEKQFAADDETLDEIRARLGNRLI